VITEWFAEKRVTARWFSILASTADEFMEDRIPSVAAGITFFVLLALFPAVGALAAIYGVFGDRAVLSHELASLTGLLPGGAMKVLAAEMTRLAALKASKVGLAFAVSLSIALWSASGGVTALIEGLNIAFELKERRSHIRILATAIGIVATAIVFGVVLVQLIALLAPVDGIIDAASAFSWSTLVLRWGAILALAVMFNMLIYRYAPDHLHGEQRWITWGSVTSAVLWVVGSALFSWYVQNFGSYDRTYGALGAVVGFLTWIWLSLVLLLLGAELDSEVKRQSRKRSAHHRLRQAAEAITDHLEISSWFR
jgi:membrane protein